MATAIIGVGNIGRAVAQHLVRGGERVVLSARTQRDAGAVAAELGPLSSSATVEAAVAQAEAVLFAVMFDAMKELLSQTSSVLDGKVVIDPSNPVAFGDDGQLHRTLPDGVSAASVIVGLLPTDAHYVKAFGTLSAGSLTASAGRSPHRVALFYTTDDDQAARTIERLITAAGFDPVKAGGVEDALRIEMFGDLHEYGGLNGRLLDADDACTALGARAV